MGQTLARKKNERTAGTIKSRQLVYYSGDRDCSFTEHYYRRKVPKEDEAVNQIILDLMTNDVFKKHPGRAGYPSFSKFERNLLSGLNYRDLHNWLREHIDLLGTIFQQERYLVIKSSGYRYGVP